VEKVPVSRWRTRASWALWQLSCRKDARQFEAALQDPESAQVAQLHSILAHAEGSQWARSHKIDGNTSIEAFRERAPIQERGAFAQWTDRIIRGESNVLTNGTVDRLVPTSGTTGHSKLIPMNRESRREFSIAVNLWLHECLRTCPSIRLGQVYIATSPALDFETGKSAVPIGFAEDTAYLGRIERRVLNQLLAVPTKVSRLRGADWRNTTRDYLTRAKDLRFLSLWHPGYLEALFDADEIRSLQTQWKDLALISCWSDGSCAPAANHLMEFFPQAKHQAKGLWLTEGAITVPWKSRCPLALSSGFFEFETESGDIKLAHQLDSGAVYRPILTNHAGLYRYRLGDLVRVESFVDKTPSLRWIGRADQIVDICGEKLSDAQVAEALKVAGWEGLALLSPVSGAHPPHYRCHVEQGTDSFPHDAFEAALRRNPHYAWARDMKQLAAIEVHEIPTDRLRAISKYGVGHEKGIHLSQELEKDE